MMRNNKLYKILRITFLILAIVLMTFTIFYKVGHCASGGGSGVDPDQYFEITDFVPVGPGYGNNFSQQEIDSICSAADSVTPFDNDIPFVDTYIIVEYDQSLNRLLLAGFCTRGNGIYTTRGTWPDTFSVTWYSTNNSYVGHSYVYVDLDDYSASWYRWSNTYFDSNVFYWFTQLPNNNYYLEKGVFYTGYPLKCPDSSFNGDIIFKNIASSGNESDKQDSIDDIDSSIEDSSQLPQVDDSAPSDPTNIPSWLQKILTGLKTFNKNMLGVGISIVDTFKKILGKFDILVVTLTNILEKLGILDDTIQFYQDYNNIKNTSSADVVSAFQGTIIYTTYLNIRSDISSFLGMFDVTPSASAPTWIIPLNGTVLYNQNYPNIVIDFGFYDRFRNTVSNILVAILTCSCVFNIIRSIPDIITGASGDESS